MIEKNNKELFLQEIEKRRIKYLIHFTPTINLMSIYNHKHVLSRDELKKNSIDHPELREYVEFNDSMRLDNLENYINLSISFPNYLLFKKFRENRKFAYMQWCVIRIDPKYIYAADTLFSVTNAASNTAKTQYGIDGSYQKFQQMFASKINKSNFYGSHTIIRDTLKNYYPTCPQSEVLVKDKIPISDIIDVCFINNDDLSATRAAINIICNESSLPFKVQADLFNIRG